MTPVRDLNDLYFFAKVADFGSYTAAAKALGLQTSKLSRRIAALEGELGVRLINRTTRRLSLTEAGKRFHRHCLALLDEAQAAKDAMTQLLGSPQGLVRISASWLSTGARAHLLSHRSAARRRRRCPRALPRKASASACNARRHQSACRRRRRRPRHRYAGTQATTGGFQSRHARVRARRDDPCRQSRIHCRARRTTDARGYWTNADAFDGERRRARDLALRRNGWRARRIDTLAAPMHGRSLHAAARGAARDWRSPYPTSRRCERFGGRHARPTAAVAEGSRGSHARGFPVAARNDSRGARAPRPPLRDCPPAPELARMYVCAVAGRRDY